MDSLPHFRCAGNTVYAETIKYMHVSRQEVDALHGFVEKNIVGNFGLIEIRPKNTSIDPVAYRYAKKLMPHFTAFALVTNDDMTFKFFEIEEASMKDIQYAIFRTLEEAESWMQAVLAKEARS